MPGGGPISGGAIPGGGAVPGAASPMAVGGAPAVGPAVAVEGAEVVLPDADDLAIVTALPLRLLPTETRVRLPSQA